MATVLQPRTTLMGNIRYEKENLIKNLDVKLFASYSDASRQVVDTTNYMWGWNGEIYRKSTGDYATWNTTGEAGRATLAENTEKNTAARANIAYRFLPGQRISASYLYNYYTRDVDDPMLPQAEQQLLETRYNTKGVFGLTYEGLWFEQKLRTTLFYKNYYTKVELSDPEQVNGEWISSDYENSMNAEGYGAAFSYAITPNLMLLLSGEKALRLPGDNELLGNTTENIESSYDLKPESSVNINVGANIGPFAWENHRMGGNFNFFYRDITDMITRSVPETSGSKTETTFQYMNLDNVLSKGFDAEFYYDYRGMIILTANLSVFNARFNTRYDREGNEYSYYKDRLRNAPYLTSNTNLEFVKRDLIQKGSRFSAYYNFGYVHEFFRNWESMGGYGKQTIPAQLVHDLGIAYTFPGHKVTLSFDVRNFTDEQVYDNWALQKAGRAFYGKISYRIF